MLQSINTHSYEHELMRAEIISGLFCVAAKVHT